MATYAIDILSGKLNVFPDGSLNNSQNEAAAPTAGDNTFTEGQIWVDTSTDIPYILVDVTAGVATWQQIGASGSVPDASETVKGILELATQAETDAGTDDTRAVTPLKLQNKSGLYVVNTVVQTSNTTVSVKEQVLVDSAGPLDLTLPATAAVGDQIYFVNINTGTFQILQHAGQSIRLGDNVTTTGITGTLISYNLGDSFTLVCTAANTDWQVINVVGNLELI